MLVSITKVVMQQLTAVAASATIDARNAYVASMPALK